MFHRAVHLSEATPAACRAAIEALADGADAILLCLADQPGLELDAIVGALSAANVPVSGGVFPAIIFGGRAETTGGVALGLRGPCHRAIVESTFAPPPTLADALDAKDLAAATWIVWVDGNVPGSATALLDAVRLDALHARASVVGGGAGHAVAPATLRGCLFTERGVLPPGGGVIVRTLARSAVAVEHGWGRLAGPFLANRATDTTIHELDWRPAAEVYAEALGASADALSPELAMYHPIAILSARESASVRDPVAMTEHGAIYTLGAIPEPSLVAILRADPDELIGAAASAAYSARQAAGPGARGLVLDCVSRRAALGPRFDEELARVQRAFGDAQVAGALTLGEIASDGKTGVAFHNKTVVVAAG